MECNRLGPLATFVNRAHARTREVVLTISTAYNSPSITLIAKQIPEMDSACKTTPKTNLNRKFLKTFIFAQISIAPYSV